MFLWTGHFASNPDKDESEFRTGSKLTPLPTDKFKAVPSLNRELTDAVSFQYVKRNGWYITCKNRVCYIQPKKRTMTFERQSSFYPLLNFWYDGYAVFESSTKAGWYLRFDQNRLVLDQYDGTKNFKQEASFLINKMIGTTPDSSNNTITEPKSNSRDLLIPAMTCSCCHELLIKTNCNDSGSSSSSSSVRSNYSVGYGHDVYLNLPSEFT